MRDDTSSYCLVLKYYEDENIYKYLDETKRKKKRFSQQTIHSLAFYTSSPLDLFF